MEYLYCWDNAALTSLDVSGCLALEWLYCDDNALTSLDVSSCLALESLWRYDNALTSLDLSKNTQLNDIGCWGNRRLTVLDLSNQTSSSLYVICDRTLERVELNENVEYEHIGVEVVTEELEVDRIDAYYYDEQNEKIALEMPRWATNAYYFDPKSEDSYYNPNATLPFYFDYYLEGKPCGSLVVGFAEERDEYDEGDVAALRSFLTQNDNGNKISANFDEDDPETYGVEWTEIGGVQRLTAVEWSGKDLVGALLDVGKTVLKWTAENGLDAYGLVASDEAKKTSVFSRLEPVAFFPGTDLRWNQSGSFLADLTADFNEKGVGYDQYELASFSVRAYLKEVGAEQAPSVYGFLLGAAVAQLIVADYAQIDRGALRNVELFNAPGISAEAIDGYVQTAENVTYYVSSGDIVSLAGETVLPGSQIWLYTFESPSYVGAELTIRWSSAMERNAAVVRRRGVDAELGRLPAGFRRRARNRGGVLRRVADALRLF